MTSTSRRSWNLPDGTRVQCFAADCSKPVKAKGLCELHYNRARTRSMEDPINGGTLKIPALPTKPCSLDGCTARSFALGICVGHYQEVAFSVPEGVGSELFDLCRVTGCGRRKRVTAPICKKCNQFRWRYSLSVEQVFDLWETSNRVCGNLGCKSPTRLHLDHDHSCCPSASQTRSNKVSCGACVRGWLCRPCNVTLGQMQESPRKIQGLLDYLNESKQ